jgi:hypothetical protein
LFWGGLRCARSYSGCRYVALARVNDGHADCPDGSDEPAGLAATARGQSGLETVSEPAAVAAAEAVPGGQPGFDDRGDLDDPGPAGCDGNPCDDAGDWGASCVDLGDGGGDSPGRVCH